MEAIGLLYLVILFAACFTLVHIARLAWLGLKSTKAKQEQPEEKPEEKPEPPKAQPVYYIVEKKRSKKASYSSPREIKFTDEK